MRPNPKHKMVMSKRPSGGILITAIQVEEWGLTAEATCEIARACSDATATEVMPMTEEAFADFVRRHRGTPYHPTLKAWPYGDRDYD